MKALFYPDVAFDSLFIPSIYREIYLDNLYENIPNTGVMIDIGANIGLVTEYFKDRAEKVYALEPSKEHFEALKANKAFNRWDNVEVFKLALADKDGEMTLNHNNTNRTCHSLIQDYKQGGETVETTRLDTFLDKNNIAKVDFLKMDTEGAEDLIFRGEGFIKATPRIKMMMVEFHHNLKHRENIPKLKSLMNYLSRLGFRFKGWQIKYIALYKK